MNNDVDFVKNGKVKGERAVIGGYSSSPAIPNPKSLISCLDLETASQGEKERLRHHPMCRSAPYLLLYYPAAG
jgi:hypothetical protein